VFEALYFWILEVTVTLAPRMIARLLAPPHRVARQVDLDLRRANPIDFSLNVEVPNVWLYFRVSNLSPVNLILDRLLIELWVGQPTFQGSTLRRVDVPARKSTEDVSFWTDLSTNQVGQIQSKANNGLLTAPVMLTLDAYFESKVGLVHVRKQLEQRDLRLR